MAIKIGRDFNMMSTNGLKALMLVISLLGVGSAYALVPDDLPSVDYDKKLKKSEQKLSASEKRAAEAEKRAQAAEAALQREQAASQAKKSPAPVVAAAPLSVSLNSSWLTVKDREYLDKAKTENVITRLNSLPRDSELLNSGPTVSIAEISAYIKRFSINSQFIDAASFIGSWNCRSIQINPSYVVGYPNFNCKIKSKDGVLRFDKTKGSQLKGGMLYQDGSSFVLLGGWHNPYVGKPSPTFDGPKGMNQQQFDVVGRFYFSKDKKGIVGLGVFSDDDGVELYWMERTTP